MDKLNFCLCLNRVMLILVLEFTMYDIAFTTLSA